MDSKESNEKSLRRWTRHIKCIRLPIFSDIQKQIGFCGTIMELGAGTCWFSARLSRLPKVSNIFAIENDSNRIKLAEEYFLKEFKAVSDKIKILEKDFHKLELPDNFTDFVVVDAALHHADNLPKVLREAHRILKDGGSLVAIREPIFSSFLPLRILRKYTFGWRERKKGKIEHIYSKEQWYKFFEDAGFSLEIKPIFTNHAFKEKIISLPILRWANGFLFSRYFFIAKKQE